MKTFTKALLHLGVVATTVAGLSGTALAQHRRGDGGYGSVSGQFNYGIWTGDEDVNAFGPGLGVRLGYTLDMGLYLGADFDYFFGESRDAGGGIPGLAAGGGSGTFNQYNVLAEIGYDFWIYDHGILRPKLGLGVGIAHISACVNVNVLGAGASTCNGDSRSGFALAPGLQFMHVFDVAYITAELRFQNDFISDISDPQAFIFGIGVGAKF